MTLPLLYAAKKAIGPRQLNDDEAKDTARRAYQNNSKLSSKEISKAIGRSRQFVDNYIQDLRAATQFDTDLKIYRLIRLGIPQDRIVSSMKESRETIKYHLVKMATLPNLPNSDLEKGFTVPQTAEKHGWPESLVLAIKLKGRPKSWFLVFSACNSFLTFDFCYLPSGFSCIFKTLALKITNCIISSTTNYCHQSFFDLIF